MKQIEQIYLNHTGMAFYWKEKQKLFSEKIQLVFKETGFYFSIAELEQFLLLIEKCYAINGACEQCEIKQACQKFLLKTPIAQIDLAITFEELEGLQDLLEGTLSRIRFYDYLFGIGRN